jgi:cytochrome c-type biogenesis protein CcmH
MTTFFIIALVIAMTGSAMVLGPVLRTYFRGHEDDPRPGITVGTGVIVALLIPVAALVLYSRWTNWNWSSGGVAATAQTEEMHSMEEAVAGLEKRLRDQPDDVQGWQMLGRSYVNMRRFDKAAEAYGRVVELTGGDNVAALADYGEVLFLSSADGMAGEAGELFRDLVPRAPDNPKVMWYGGIAAFEDGDDEQGTRLWTRLLDMNPPDAMRQIIEERIGPAAAAEAPSAAATPSAAEALEPVADGAIRVRVSVDPFLAQQVNGSVPLFIFARGAAGGPPLAAVRRSAAELPLVLDLSDESAMIDGVRISDQDALTLVARLSMSGSPRQQSGDFFGQVSYSRENGNEVEIRIDQVVP